jgi:hypothetical protein
MMSVCPPINFRMPEPIFIKLGMHIMEPEPISTAYFINPAHQSVCLYVYASYCFNGSVNYIPPSVARQRPSKNLTATTNILNNRLDASFSMRTVSYQRKVGA